MTLTMRKTAMGNWTVPGTSVVLPTTADVANYVVQSLFYTPAGFGQTPSETQASINAETAKAMGPNADPADVADAQAQAWALYQGDYQQSLALQAANDQPLPVSSLLPTDPSTYLWLALIGIAALVVVPPLIQKFA